MIQKNDFVEWGEYNGNLYGTTIDAIRAIRYKGQVCLMSPMNPAQAMPKLCTANIQAYVVFVMMDENNLRSSTVNESFEDEEKLVVSSKEMFNKYHAFIDRVLFKEDFEQLFRDLENASFGLTNDDQFVPSRWIPN